MKLAQLETLLVVIDTGSFSNAALELDTSQSAVSYTIAELERELGAKLLLRGRFGAEPTELGLKIATHARGISQHIKAINQEVSVAHGPICGELRVVVFRSVAGKIMPKLMSQLKEQHPYINIRLLELDHLNIQGKVQLLREHCADISFIDYLPPIPHYNDLLVWEIMRDPYKGIIPASDKRKLLEWSEIPCLPLILHESDECALRVQNFLQDLGTPVQPKYQVMEDSTIVRMVSQELGISLLPELAIDELPENTKVVPTSSLLERGIAITLLPSVLKTPSIKVFLEILKQSFPDSDVPKFTRAAYSY